MSHRRTHITIVTQSGLDSVPVYLISHRPEQSPWRSEVELRRAVPALGWRYQERKQVPNWVIEEA